MRSSRRRALAAAILFLAAVAGGAPAATAPPGRGGYAPPGTPSTVVPPALREVGYDQRLGETLALDVRLRDEAGGAVRLGDFFGARPVVLALVYYDCPMLCTLVLNGLTGALKAVDLVPGRDFEVVVVSFDPREGPELARAKKAVYLDRYGRPETAGGWHFLTGEREQIAALTAAAGFRYTFDTPSGQFAHPSGVVVATADGRLSRYLFGTDFAPRDLRLALVESGAGRIGTWSDQVMLFCFHYDPATGRYSAAVLNLVRAGGVAAVVGLVLLVAALARRKRKAA